MRSNILFLVFLVFAISGQGQGLKGLIKKAAGKDSSAIDKLVGGKKDSLALSDVVAGLKEALETGTVRGVQQLSAVDGFFKDVVLRILIPAEAKKVESTLRKFGMGKQVDEAILSMNRAAEDATQNAGPIFIRAIRELTIQDGWSILRGDDSAATRYLRQKTLSALTEAFRPVIERSLEKTNATKHWNTIFSNYNRFSKETVNTDLAAYVTDKATYGIFYQVALEEGRIRKDPVARTTDLLKKVFGR